MSEQITDILSSINKSKMNINTTLLSNKTIKVTMSPITVKDQKALIVNTSNEKSKGQLLGLIELLKSCVTKSPIKVEDMYIQDFTWLILNLRAKSVGEVIDLSGVCEYCDSQNVDIKLDLEKDIKIKYLKKIKDNKIVINDDVTLILDFLKVKHLSNTSLEEKDISLDIISNEIDYIEYKGEIVEVDNEDKINILEQMSIEQLNKFNDFKDANKFGIEVNVKFKCDSCDKENNLKVKEEVLGFF